jgi:hypothetical protein
VTDAERLDAIAKKLSRPGYLPHDPDVERDMVWLLERLRERDVCVAELEARMKQNDWIFLLP